MQDAYNLSNLEPLFKKQLLAENISSVSLKNYLSDFRHFIGWLGLYKSQNLSTNKFLFDEETLKNYLLYLKNANIPEATLSRRLSTLRKFCTFCFNSGYLAENYLANVGVKPSNTSKFSSGPQVNVI